MSEQTNGQAYWKANLRLIGLCLTIWFVVSYLFGIVLVDADGRRVALGQSTNDNERITPSVTTESASAQMSRTSKWKRLPPLAIMPS